MFAAVLDLLETYEEHIAEVPQGQRIPPAARLLLAAVTVARTPNVPLPDLPDAPAPTTKRPSAVTGVRRTSLVGELVAQPVAQLGEPVRLVDDQDDEERGGEDRQRRQRRELDRGGDQRDSSAAVISRCQLKRCTLRQRNATWASR